MDMTWKKFKTQEGWFRIAILLEGLTAEKTAETNFSLSPAENLCRALIWVKSKLKNLPSPSLYITGPAHVQEIPSPGTSKRQIFNFWDHTHPVNLFEYNGLLHGIHSLIRTTEQTPSYPIHHYIPKVAPKVTLFICPFLS
jgi:hypothetical protein